MSACHGSRVATPGCDSINPLVITPAGLRDLIAPGMIGLRPRLAIGKSKRLRN